MTSSGATSARLVRPLLVDDDGRLYVTTNITDESVYHYTPINNLAETTVWDPTAGTKFVLTDLLISANNTCNVAVKDGTAGATISLLYILQNTTAIINLSTPIVSVAADNNLTATTSVASVFVTTIGYEI